MYRSRLYGMIDPEDELARIFNYCLKYATGKTDAAKAIEELTPSSLQMARINTSYAYILFCACRGLDIPYPFGVPSDADYDEDMTHMVDNNTD